MDKALARKIIEDVRSLDMLLNEIDAQLRQIQEDAERIPLLRSLAQVIGELDSGIVRPIARKYPDLDPDK